MVLWALKMSLAVMALKHKLFLFLRHFVILRSFRVRNYWGQLMRNGTARRDFANVQIHNIITLATRIRIIIMKVCHQLR